jgi:hypothetical protein
MMLQLRCSNVRARERKILQDAYWRQLRLSCDATPPALVQRAVVQNVRPGVLFHALTLVCTGFEAIAAFAREMPDQFILNTAGTTYFEGGTTAPS